MNFLIQGITRKMKNKDTFSREREERERVCLLGEQDYQILFCRQRTRGRHLRRSYALQSELLLIVNSS